MPYYPIIQWNIALIRVYLLFLTYSIYFWRYQAFILRLRLNYGLIQDLYLKGLINTFPHTPRMGGFVKIFLILCSFKICFQILGWNFFPLKFMFDSPTTILPLHAPDCCSGPFQCTSQIERSKPSVVQSVKSYLSTHQYTTFF